MPTTRSNAPAVVFDTNVLVSSLWRGRCWEAVQLLHDGRVTLAVSAATLQEYREVLKRFANLDELKRWTDLLIDAEHVKLVEPSERIDAIRDDPSDNRFLECAVAGKAAAIISGDRHLLELETFRDIPIITPAAFLTQFTR